MKFIRTIIDERSRGKAPVPALGAPVSNRTFTRISGDGMADDALQRLIAQNEAADAAGDDDPLRAILEDRDDDDNLFADDAGDADDPIDGWEDEDDNAWSYDDDPAGPDALEKSPPRMSDAPEPRQAVRPEARPEPQPEAQPEPQHEPAAPAPRAEVRTQPLAETRTDPRPADPALGRPVAGRSADPMPEPAIAEPAAADMQGLQEAMRATMPAPASGRSGQSVGRVKTRLLGFGGDMGGHDPFAKAGTGAATRPEDMRFPVGWLVIVAGPGRGHAFALSPGVSQIGRGEDMTIRLDFGDTAISRSNHAAIAYDPEEGAFYLGHGGKANMVRLNNRPVLSTEPMSHGAVIRIGETTLRFAAFCDSGFQWDRNGKVDHASNQ